MAAAAVAAAPAPPGPPRARPPPPRPPAEIAVKAEGAMASGSLAAGERARYRLFVEGKGTVLVRIDAIHGPDPRARIMNKEGKTIRFARLGQLWARPPAGTELFLEVTPGYRGAATTYQLSVAFDVDRPRERRADPRPVRPGDMVKVPLGADVHELDQVRVDGLLAEVAVRGGDAIVTVPALARTGSIELRFETRPTRTVEVELIGAERASDRVSELCGSAEPGCLAVVVGPAVGTLWLEAIARIVDADIARHVVASGSVVLKLRMPSSERFALDQLRRTRGVLSAQPLT
jgi:hypothetical protein